MRGFTGIIRRSPYEGIEGDLQRMVATLVDDSHRCTSQYVDRNLGLYLGWVHASGTDGAHAPLICNRDDVFILFEGESHGDVPIADGVSPSYAASASRLLSLYDELGIKGLSRLNGWFSGVIVDKRERTVRLFNDRYGMRRVYVHQAEDECLFGTEAKALLKVRRQLRRLNLDGLAQYLRFDCVLNDSTLYEGIELLPSASSWTFSAASAVPDKTRFFTSSQWEQQSTLPPDEFALAFDETITKIVPEYVESDGRIGLSLTAGLDTRLIVAALGKGQSERLSCHTFGGTWGDTYDIRTGRKLAELLGRPFSVYRADSTFVSNFSRYARRSVSISDGTHDAIGAHDVFFGEQLRESATTIRVNGKFGSEVVRIRKLIPTCSYDEDFIEPALRTRIDALPASPTSATSHPLSKAVFAEIPWHEYGRVAVEQAHVTMRTPYMDNRLVELMFRAPDQTRAAGELQPRYIKERSPQLGSIPTDMGGLGKRSDLVGRLLYGAYRALFKLEYIYVHATPHWVTRVDRRLANLHFERILAGRQRYEGYRIWLQKECAEFVRDTLLRPQASCTEFFNKRRLDLLVTRHLAGTHNYLAEINKALTIELIHSELLR